MSGGGYMENVLMHILVVNINGLQYTKDAIGDLLKQTVPFNLTLIDQGSSEEGTENYINALTSVPYPNIGLSIIRNKGNVPLNHLWNDLYKNSTCDLLCFLNNDVRVPSNFVEDTLVIFKEEDNVGMVVHATNHPLYQETHPLCYVIMDTKIAQGWDFTIRRAAYVPIPEDIHYFGGDDWLFVQAYRKGWKLATALSSPIIHYKGQSRKYYTGDRLEEDALIRTKYSIERVSYRSPYTKQSPKFNAIIERK
jgi:GT2 family glycosyltransferase